VPTVFYEVAMSSDKQGDAGIARVDGHGRMLSMVVGQIFEMRLETEEEAKKTEKGGDLFVFGMAKIDQPIGAAPKVESLTMEVAGDGASKVVAGPRQAVVRDETTGVVVVELGAEFDKTPPATPKEIEEGLAETVALPIRSPIVAALSKDAVGDAKTDREKVDRLIHFVSKYVDDALGFAELPVAEIITRKKGDCTEHARLFAALARAAGVPTREVAGLMYMGDDVKAFGGHAWDEVVLDGRWVPVDPTWDETLADAAHLTLEREGKGMSYISTVGALSFRLKDVKKAK
jgi:protein-glutamine gamma-glutamyltransferase